MHALYDYVDGYWDKEAAWRADRLKTARSALDAAAIIVHRREAGYRVPADRIAGWRANPTAYHFGYLWSVRSLYYWWRDEGKAIDAPVSPCYLNVINPADVGFGEGMATDALRVLGERALVRRRPRMPRRAGNTANFSPRTGFPLAPEHRGATMDRRMIEELEACAYAAWPAGEIVDLAGCASGFTHGVTRRGNSVWTNAASGDLLLDQRIAGAEAFYRDRGMAATFQLTPLQAPAELDQALARRGYRNRRAGRHSKSPTRGPWRKARPRTLRGSSVKSLPIGSR